MLTDDIPEKRMRDCLALLGSVCSPKEFNEIAEIRLQTGGLFNFLLRIQTSERVMFFKQYLDDMSSEIYSLPKIPAMDRARLAYEVQELAYSATEHLQLETVPKLIHLDEKRSAFLMAEANGSSALTEYLSRGEIPSVVLNQLPLALACLHRSTHGLYSTKSLFGNREFRDFKLNLQYDGIRAHLTESEAKIVMQCKERYQARSACVTHGDINSRNIIVGPSRMGIIDFEQSHLGAPSYDIAYILCEILISAVQFRREKDITEIFTRFIDHYFEESKFDNRDECEREITQHLAIQTIYRFVGPSRASWTYYVDAAIAAAILNMCRQMLKSNIPVSEVNFPSLLAGELSGKNCRVAAENKESLPAV